MSEKRTKKELEFSSSNFDPLKALKHPDEVKLPCPSAPLLDNISCFIETPEGIFPKPPRQPREQKPKDKLPKTEHIKEEPSSIEVQENTKKGTWVPIADLLDISDISD